MFPRKYRIHAALVLICLLIIFLPLYTERPDEEKARAASAAAAEFFVLIDADRFAESWQSSAELLKEKITEAEWVEQLRKTRAVTGPLVVRAQEEMIYSTTAKDSPEGEYILTTFEADFKNVSGAKETITVMLENGSDWRVAGYFIQ